MWSNNPPFFFLSSAILECVFMCDISMLCYDVHASQGGIVDEEALDEALGSGKLAGAALDCFASEPVLEPQPLTKHAGLIAAPHCTTLSHWYLIKHRGRPMVYHGRPVVGSVALASAVLSGR